MYSDFVFDAMIYLFVVWLALPFLVLAAASLRLIRVGVPECLALLPGGLLGLVIFDVMLFKSWGARHIWSFPAEFLAIAGWILFLPALIILSFLSVAALSGIAARTFSKRDDAQ